MTFNYYLSKDLENIPLHVYRILPWDKIKNIKSIPIKNKNILSSDYSKIRDRIFATCVMEDGVGLAAPQIGIFQRMFIIRRFSTAGKALDKFTVYINPSWEAAENSEREISDEYCLSVPGKKFPISRFKKIIISYLSIPVTTVPSETLTDFLYKTEELSGLEARIFQHEFSHLNGISIPQLYDAQNKKPSKTIYKRNK